MEVDDADLAAENRRRKDQMDSLIEEAKQEDDVSLTPTPNTFTCSSAITHPI